MNTDKTYFERIAERGQLIVFSGPECVGKSALIKQYMIEHPNAYMCPTVTTRWQGDDEVEGEQHYFLSHTEFERLVRSQQLLEYEYHNQNGYGTTRKAVEIARNEGHNVIMIVDVAGAMRVRALCDDATLIFILPPTWDEIEVKIRAKYADKPDLIEEKLQIAKEEIVCAEQYDYILINDTFEKTVRRMDQIIHGNRYNRISMRPFMESYIESEIRSDLTDEIRSI